MQNWLTCRGTRPQRLSAELATIVGVEEARDLAAILGVEETSRAECVKLLRAYLKANELQDPANRQCFLTTIVDVEEASCAKCVKLLWASLKADELQDPAITPDEKMAPVFCWNRKISWHWQGELSYMYYI